MTQYFMTMFGTEKLPHPRFLLVNALPYLNAASRSHTFATFWEIAGKNIREVTISWMPDWNFLVRGSEMPRLWPVPGRNYTLDETFKLMKGKAIQHWGPFEISPTFYQKAQMRAGYLESGLVKYKMAAPFLRHLRKPALKNERGAAINCVMGVSDLGGYLPTGTAFGITASQLVMDHLARQCEILDYSRGARKDVLLVVGLSERIYQYGLTPSKAA